MRMGLFCVEILYDYDKIIEKMCARDMKWQTISVNRSVWSCTNKVRISLFWRNYITESFI